MASLSSNYVISIAPVDSYISGQGNLGILISDRLWTQGYRFRPFNSFPQCTIYASFPAAGCTNLKRWQCSVEGIKVVCKAMGHSHRHYFHLKHQTNCRTTIAKHRLQNRSILDKQYNIYFMVTRGSLWRLSSAVWLQK